MKSLWAVILVLLATLATGCVKREMTVTSEPSGARVWVSGEEKGITPVTIPFTWYGDYDIVLRKDGYETKKTHANIILPWYEVPPLDLFSEMAPWTYHDQRYLHFSLEEAMLPGDADLMESAAELQKRNIQPME